MKESAQKECFNELASLQQKNDKGGQLAIGAL